MFAVAVALSLAVLTIMIPAAIAATLTTAALSLLAGSHALRESDGLTPNVFATGVYLSSLVLVSAAAWQGVLSLAALRAAAPTTTATPPQEGAALAKAKETSLVQDFLQRPWATLGLWLFLIDAVLVRWRVKGFVHGLDALVAAAVLTSMIWATVFVAVFCVRSSITMLRQMWKAARQSQFVAGMVTLGGLGVSAIGGLLLTVLGVLAGHQLEQHKISLLPHHSPSDSGIEQARLALQEVSRYKKNTTPALAAGDPEPGLPALSDTNDRRTGWAAADSPLFAKCIDKMMKPDTGEDALKTNAQWLAWQFSLSELDARGLVIDTMISVCRKKPTEAERLAGYFQRSLRNAARNFRRRFWREAKECSIEIVPVLELEASDDSTWDFSDPLTARQAFCKLSELDQTLIKERVVMGRSFVEIGDLYDMSDNKAQKAFDRAMSRLSELFEKK